MTTINSAPSFSIGFGIVTTDFGYSNEGYSVAVQADGKILVAGTAGTAYNGSVYFDFALARYNPDGSLDTTFDGDGKLTTDFGSSNDSGQSVTVQADGKILVAGSGLSDFMLARYNPDGSLDTTFDGDGKVTTDFGSTVDSGRSVVVQADGKILVAGTSLNGSGSDFALARYNADGTLDNGFGTGGKVTTDFGGYDWGSRVVMQADGKILVAGEGKLARYNSNGSLDSTFSGDGMLTTDDFLSGYGYSATVQADGKILVAGTDIQHNSNDFGLARYNPDGTLDTTFGSGGKVSTNFGFFTAWGYDDMESDDHVYSVTVQTDGKILVAGQSNYLSSDWNTPDFALARYNPDGSLDTTFGSGGKVTTDIGIYSDGYDAGDWAYSVAVQSDGTILVAGESYIDIDGRGHDFTLVRYNPDGSLDDDTLGDAAYYFKDCSPAVLDSDVRIRDAELDALAAGLGDYNGATLTLARHGGASANDVFSATATGTLSALTQGSTFSVGGIDIGSVTTNSGGVLGLSFNHNATTARVNEAMRQIAYSNTSITPPASVQVDWTFSDGNFDGAQGTGGALSTTGTTIVRIVDANMIVGTVDNDTLTGTYGSDCMMGLDGNDVLYGLDDSDRLDGGNGDDQLNGGIGNDALYGGAGNDTLDGGTGSDALYGGTGNDTYVVNNPGDTISEYAGQGTDLVQSWITYTLPTRPNYIENLQLMGTESLNGTGNEFDNTLTGNAGNNILDGSAGADTLTGGAGDDTYVVDNAGDSVTESASAGTDTVQSGVTYTLGANLENLTLTGTATINGIGNILDNILTGNDAANTLGGSDGNDTLYGGGGNDTLWGGGDSGADTLDGGNGNDILNGGDGNDILNGGDDNDELWGNAGADTLTGGDGNDTYGVSSAGDNVSETGTGTDTVESYNLSYTLGTNLENLTLTGTAATNGTGNGLDNTLTGNDAANTLGGSDGNDYLYGSNGNDYLYGSNGNDTLNGGNDNDTLDGGAGADTLDGGSGNDLLNGWADADTLTGGLGTDTFAFGTVTGGADTVTDFASGTDKLRFRSDSTLLNIGDGDTVLDSSELVTGPGGFFKTTELVVVSGDISGTISNSSAATAIGSASAAYAVDDRRLFAVDNGTDSALYLFKSAGADALVSATELTLIGTLQGTASTALADYTFV
jgi:serralysin